MTHAFGIPMVLVTVALAFGLAVTAIAASLGGRPPRLGRLALIAGGWAVIYAAVLLSVSLASRERVLGWGDDKAFCGFYLDCHTRIAVTVVDVRESLGDVRPEGRFHVVTLRIGNDAKRARLRLRAPRLTVTDATGRRFVRSPAGEAAVARTRPPRTLTEELGPGDTFQTVVVFDLPVDAREPRLAVTEGWWADRLIEFFLVGDEDSFLHARTTFRLTT